jgi:hypothetical protein
VSLSFQQFFQAPDGPVAFAGGDCHPEFCQLGLHVLTLHAHTIQRAQRPPVRVIAVQTLYQQAKGNARAPGLLQNSEDGALTRGEFELNL